MLKQTIDVSDLSPMEAVLVARIVEAIKYRKENDNPEEWDNIDANREFLICECDATALGNEDRFGLVQELCGLIAFLTNDASKGGVA